MCCKYVPSPGVIVHPYMCVEVFFPFRGMVTYVIEIPLCVFKLFQVQWVSKSLKCIRDICDTISIHRSMLKLVIQ